MISRIIKVEVGAISRSRRVRLITLAENRHEAYKLEEEYAVLVVLKYHCAPTFHFRESAFKVNCKYS